MSDFEKRLQVANLLMQLREVEKLISTVYNRVLADFEKFDRVATHANMLKIDLNDTMHMLEYWIGKCEKIGE